MSSITGLHQEAGHFPSDRVNMSYMASRGKDRHVSHKAVKLEKVARYLKLAKGTVSVVLNESPAAKAIPQSTKDRIFAAASKLGYRPNFFARTLVKKPTFTIGVITEEIGDPYGGMVISGIERFLSQNKYFFITVAAHASNRLTHLAIFG